MILNSIREQIMTNMSDAMRCTIFDRTINHDSFTHIQQQVSVSQTPLQTPTFSKRYVEYECAFEKQSDFNNARPTAIIPIRDCPEIIIMCLESMKKTGTFDLINVIVVDDRSNVDIKSVANSYGISYLRIDYTSTFNFSMLCNIAAKICKDLGNSQVIMWNADLYISDRKNLEILIAKHNKNNSDISGTKLLYPPIEYSISNEYDTHNILTHFPSMAGKWRGTVQFGGSKYIDIPNSAIHTSPIHKHRFETKEKASYDAKSDFVTGAFQMLELYSFISIGGYNPSLEKNFQDVELCKATSNVWYFGQDVEFYHDESPVFEAHKNKSGKQIISDQILYDLLNSKEYTNE